DVNITPPRHRHRPRCHARRILVRGPFFHEPSQTPSPRAGGPTHSCSSTLAVTFAPSSAWRERRPAPPRERRPALLVVSGVSKFLESERPPLPANSNPERPYTCPTRATAAPFPAAK